MKKQIYLTLISLAMFVQNNFGQATTGGNLWGSGVNEYLGWDNASNTPLNVKTELATPINFYTGATGPGGFTNMRMRILGAYNGGNGLIGMGDMGTLAAPFTPQSELHTYRTGNTNVFHQFTNDNTGSANNTNGYRTGIECNVTRTASDATFRNYSSNSRFYFSSTDANGIHQQRLIITEKGEVVIDNLKNENLQIVCADKNGALVLNNALQVIAQLQQQVNTLQTKMGEMEKLIAAK